MEADIKKPDKANLREHHRIDREKKTETLGQMVNSLCRAICMHMSRRHFSGILLILRSEVSNAGRPLERVFMNK